MDGILVVNKPKQYTSYDVVAIVKKKLGEKVGHTGTLDPNATGVLPLLIGQGTKLSQFLIEHDKTYIATLKLGIKTDTGDVEGNLVEERTVPEEIWQEAKIEEILQTFLGNTEQCPPMYSAIKVKGKKLYEYARKGEKVEVPKRQITIYKIALQEILPQEKEIRFLVHCSKGTYIRTLCEDIAVKLKTVGYMKELERKTVGRFQIEEAISLEELEKMSKEEIEKKMISMEEFFKERPQIDLPKEKVVLFQNGVCLEAREVDKQSLPEGVYRIYTNQEFLGIGQAKNNRIKREIILKKM